MTEKTVDGKKTTWVVKPSKKKETTKKESKKDSFDFSYKGDKQ